ncbi:helix-turn-helix domain-containing protein [Streptosporangium amethystogenes subsp. fukuiense]|uniref:Helix-turn-helix domain-containing protein n=1 Tax=Streptosporangium amethystogenes subsp. fukuiense TaxID=698418 RepID=A0ABW2SYQ4_9ACTN
MGGDRNLFHHPLTYLRHQRGWTLADVAELVRRRSGLNMATHRQKIHRWERGTVPELDAQFAIAEEVGVDPNTVLALPWPSWLLTVHGTEPLHEAWTASTAKLTLTGCLDASTDRRAFPLIAGDDAARLASAWAAVPAQKISHAANGGTVDTDVTNWVECRTRQLWHLDDLVGGDYCLNLAQADLQLVARLLHRGRYRAPVEQRLLGLAGELLRFAGWCAFDSGRQAAADRYWHAGLRTSATGGDTLTGAYILSLMAMQHTYAGDGRAALNLLHTARQRIGAGASRTVHAMLDAWQVRAHAAVGEQRQAIETLFRADDHWGRRTPDDDPPWIYWMRQPSHTIEVGLGFVRLGRSDIAVRLLEQGIADRGGDYTRDAVLGLAAVAAAELDQGDLGSALDTARRAADLLPGVESSRAADQLRAFAGRLPDGEPTAKEFRTYLESLPA